MHHILFGCMLLLTTVTAGPYATAEESTLESAAALQPMDACPGDRCQSAGQHP